MWHLIWAQLRYSGWVLGLSFVASTILLVAVALTSRTGESQTLMLVTGGIFSLFGLWLGAYLWLRDVRERRGLSWLDLPIHPRAWLGTRLVIPVLLTLGSFLACFIGWATHAVAAGGLPFTEWARTVVPGHGIVLTLLMLFPFSEEMNFYFRRFHRGLLLFNGLSLVALGVFVGLAIASESPLALTLVSYGAALFMALATAWAYERRDNYLVVSNPLHGLPVDLARGEERFSLR